ncbi:MAG TPA: immunity 26/phosphotriesterase HocA family protein [Kribbellaceae bacterium]|nr:immunity 26/phosphotriesterase HocA family protein [Kribbellaceae bacterium]
MSNTNLQSGRRSRHTPKVGDVFKMQLPDKSYLFGRVILADSDGPTPGSILVYIYEDRAEEVAADPTALSPARLLIPPVFTHRALWNKGYFETVANHALKETDLIEQHCFWDVMRSKYVDEHGQPLPGRVDPCGVFALASLNLIDTEISDALGIPRAD